MKEFPAYLYLGIHYKSGKIYIGARSANKCSPQDDFGKKYFTSSKRVKPYFEEYTWYILYESFDAAEIFEFEYELISTHLHSGKLENISARGIKFGMLNKKHTIETRKKMKLAQAGAVCPAHIVAKFAKTFIVQYKEEPEFQIVNLQKFCRENSLCAGHMIGIAKGVRFQHKGWKCRYVNDDNYLFKPKDIGKLYNLISPSNEKVQIQNLSKFCKENSLAISNMIKVAKGERPHHKGWKCEYGN